MKSSLPSRHLGVRQSWRLIGLSEYSHTGRWTVPYSNAACCRLYQHFNENRPWRWRCSPASLIISLIYWHIFPFQRTSLTRMLSKTK